MQKKDRSLKNLHSEIKVQVLARWKRGDKISSIAKDVEVSRETIYRWIRESDLRLAKTTQRSRHLLDEDSKFKIMEAYFLLGAPSVPDLKQVLEEIYFIRLSIPQLRRWLIRLKISKYQVSPHALELLRQRLKS